MIELGVVGWQILHPRFSEGDSFNCAAVQGARAWTTEPIQSAFLSGYSPLAMEGDIGAWPCTVVGTIVPVYGSAYLLGMYRCLHVCIQYIWIPIYLHTLYDTCRIVHTDSEENRMSADAAAYMHLTLRILPLSSFRICVCKFWYIHVRMYMYESRYVWVQVCNMYVCTLLYSMYVCVARFSA